MTVSDALGCSLPVPLERTLDASPDVVLVASLGAAFTSDGVSGIGVWALIKPAGRMSSAPMAIREDKYFFMGKLFMKRSAGFHAEEAGARGSASACALTTINLDCFAFIVGGCGLLGVYKMLQSMRLLCACCHVAALGRVEISFGALRDDISRMVS